MKKQYPIFYSVECLRDYYNRTSQGHWFDPATMRFFGTRLNDFRKLSDSRYAFVSTERSPSGDRKASIRLVTLKRDKSFCGLKISIETLGDFHSMTLRTAQKKLKGL